MASSIPHVAHFKVVRRGKRRLIEYEGLLRSRLSCELFGVGKEDSIPLLLFRGRKADWDQRFFKVHFMGGHFAAAGISLIRGPGLKDEFRGSMICADWFEPGDQFVVVGLRKPLSRARVRATL